MNTFLPQLPWYTWLASIVLSIIGAGLLWALILGLARVVFILFSLAWYGIQLFLIYCCNIRLSTFGTAHWAGYFEVKRAGLLRNDGIPLGTWKGKNIHEPTGGNVLLMGPPRSRKSWGLVMPAIEQCPGSLVVSDLRGELYERTHTARERLGPVYRFAPTSLDSCSLNIFDNVRWGSAYEFGDVHRIIEHLLRPPKNEPDNPFRLTAVPVLIGIACDRAQHGACSFPGIVEWMLDPTTSLTDKVQTLLASSHPVAQAAARRLLDQSERLQSAVWNAALLPMTIFQDPLVAQNSRKSDVFLRDLLHGTQPVSLYLVMGFHEIGRMGIFLGTITETLVALLGSPTSPPRHQVLLALDECANLGHLAELERAVSYLQGSGTQALLAFQNYSQVLDTYGEHTPLLASISTQVHYRPNDVLTAETIAKYLGQVTVIATSHSVGEQMAVTDTPQARNLLTADEILRLPSDTALIVTAGTAPLWASKLGKPALRSRTAWLWERLSWHPFAYSTATACLLLSLALWPLTDIHAIVPRPRTLAGTLASTTPTLAGTTQKHGTVQDVQKDNARWTLYEANRNRDGKPIELPRGHYATMEECQASFTSIYQPLVNMMQHDKSFVMTKEPLSWQWEVSIFQGHKQQYHVWCAEHKG